MFQVYHCWGHQEPVLLLCTVGCPASYGLSPLSLQVVALSSWCLLRDSIYYTLSVVALIVVSVWGTPRLNSLTWSSRPPFLPPRVKCGSSAWSRFGVPGDK